MFRFYCVLSAAFIVLIGACQQVKNPNAGDGQNQQIPNEYAQLFRLSIQQNDTFLDIYGANHRTIGSYFWGKSENVSNRTKLIRGRSYIVLSAVFARMIQELGAVSQIVGVDNREFFPSDIQLNPKTRSLQASGILNKEALLKLKPNITFTYLLDGRGEKDWARLQQNGHSVVFIQNHLESTPLARAEWIRAVGWALGKPQVADSLFLEITRKYKALQSQVTDASEIPVMLNLPFEGIWHIPNRSAYFTQFLIDAKLQPAWLKNGNFVGTGASNLPLEEAIKMIQQSKLWLNLGNIKKREEITRFDPRLERVLQLQELRYFHNDKQIEKSNANSFWDLGSVHPEMVLKDLIQIRKGYSSDSLHFYREL